MAFTVINWISHQLQVATIPSKDVAEKERSKSGLRHQGLWGTKGGIFTFFVNSADNYKMSASCKIQKVLLVTGPQCKVPLSAGCDKRNLCAGAAWWATKKMGSSATTLCPSYCTFPIVCYSTNACTVLQSLSSSKLCPSPTAPTAPLRRVRHNPGKIPPVIKISVHSVMVARGGKQDRSFECRCAKTDGLSMDGTDLMGKLLIASIDFMSSRVAQKLITDWSVVVNHVGCFQTGKHGRHLNNTCKWKDIATIGNSKTLQCTNVPMYQCTTILRRPQFHLKANHRNNLSMLRKPEKSEIQKFIETKSQINLKTRVHFCIVYQTSAYCKKTKKQ